ncbi:hypothetical protein ACQPW3_11150 [Actinosynnema sp. CA-248983]
MEAPAVNEAAAVGVERYLWVYTQEGSVFLSLPGVRDLRLSIRDARALGDSLSTNAAEAEKWREMNKGTTEETED